MAKIWDDKQDKFIDISNLDYALGSIGSGIHLPSNIDDIINEYKSGARTLPPPGITRITDSPLSGLSNINIADVSQPTVNKNGSTTVVIDDGSGNKTTATKSSDGTTTTYTDQDGNQTVVNNKKPKTQTEEILDLMKQYQSMYQPSHPQADNTQILNYQNSLTEAQKIYATYNFPFGFTMEEKKLQIKDQLFLLRLLQTNLRRKVEILNTKGGHNNGILQQKGIQQKLRKTTRPRKNTNNYRKSSKKW